MRISDWSSDVCSSDLRILAGEDAAQNIDVHIFVENVDVEIEQADVLRCVVEIRVGRIVVKDVDLSKGADGRVDHGSDLFARTDINGQRQRLTTRRFYLRNDAARGDRKSTRLNSSH